MSDEQKFFVTDTSSQESLTTQALQILLGIAPSVEQQEAAGASEFRDSTVLPTDCGNKADYEKMGIVWGEVVKEDPLFTYATLPKGWTKVSDDRDSRHIALVDESGKKRASIFVKNASYDRKAYMHVCHG